MSINKILQIKTIVKTILLCILCINFILFSGCLESPGRSGYKPVKDFTEEEQEEADEGEPFVVINVFEASCNGEAEDCVKLQFEFKSSTKEDYGKIVLEVVDTYPKITGNHTIAWTGCTTLSTNVCEAPLGTEFSMTFTEPGNENVTAKTVTIKFDEMLDVGQYDNFTEGQQKVTSETRPTGQINIDKGLCACLNGKPDILGNCDSFCSSKNVETPTLYASVNLGPEVALNENLGSLTNWCNTEIDDGNVSPSCSLAVFDGVNTIKLEITLLGGNSFTANIFSLTRNTTYVAYLVENTSGAKTDSFQIRRIDPPDTSQDIPGPLKIMPVSQYTCINRAGSSLGGDIFENAVRLHFYFASNSQPQPLPPGDNFLFCHDINLHGVDDSPLFSRLELIPQAFTLWDQSDLRFHDLDNSGKIDINEILQEKLLDEYGVSKSLNIFYQFQWASRPNIQVEGDEGSSQTQNNTVLGYYMSPWINAQTGRAFCPNQENYNSGDPSADPTFKVMKEVIGVDTEGLYFGVKQPSILVDSEGNQTSAPTDIIIVRGGLLEKIWFYYENNQHFIPDEVTSTQKTIMFYWPADVDDPYIRKSTQEIYTVTSSYDLANQSTSGIQTNVRPADKRFGCIPALTE